MSTMTTDANTTSVTATPSPATATVPTSTPVVSTSTLATNATPALATTSTTTPTTTTTTPTTAHDTPSFNLVPMTDMSNMSMQVPITDPSQHVTFCPHCTLRLSYPAGSTLIQCPQCIAVIDPLAPQQTRCVQCRCLLAYPGSSIYIQCPNCYQTQDPRAVPVQFTTYLSRSGDPNTKLKKRKDPSAPKAVSNAYMIFCQMRRAELKVQQPELPFGKIGAKLGEIWRNMTNEEKKPYEDLAEEDKERYRKEMLVYQASRMGDLPPDTARRRLDEEGNAASASTATTTTPSTTTATDAATNSNTTSTTSSTSSVPATAAAAVAAMTSADNDNAAPLLTPIIPVSPVVPGSTTLSVPVLVPVASATTTSTPAAPTITTTNS